MKKTIILIILLLAVATANLHALSIGEPIAASDQTSSEEVTPLEGFDALFNVNGDVAQIFQWRPGAEVESNYPDFDFSDFMRTYYVWMNEDFDPTFDFHNFSINYNGKQFFNDSFRERLFPYKISFSNIAGKYNIIWSNGLPVRFTLDESQPYKATEDRIDPVEFKLGFEWFTISYYPNGLPLKLTGKLLPQYHNGDFYSELYDDYEFNETGKWIKRKVTSSFGMGSDSSKGKRTNNEYRVYIPR